MMIEEDEEEWEEEDHHHNHHLNLDRCSLGDTIRAACGAVVDARVSCGHLKKWNISGSAFLAFLGSSQNLLDTQILGGFRYQPGNDFFRDFL